MTLADLRTQGLVLVAELDVSGVGTDRPLVAVDVEIDALERERDEDRSRGRGDDGGLGDLNGCTGVSAVAQRPSYLLIRSP